MENDILDSLNDLCYNGPLDDEAAFSKALEGGHKSLEYTKLVHILAEELKKLCNLEETVNIMNDPDESSSFLLELSSFLKELGCPYKKLITGHMSSRLQTKEDRLLLLDYMISELMAARMVNVDCAKEKTGKMEIVVHESPTAKDLKEILIALKFNKPPPNITAEMLFSKLEAKLKVNIQKEGGDLVGKPLYNKTLSEKEWRQLETDYSEMFEEYALRRETLITRLECTIQSFEWSERLRSKKDVIQSMYRPKREQLRIKPLVPLSDFLAARTDLLSVEKTSSASVRRNTQSEVNKVIIGKVPDRGGRPNEQQPPPPEMPSWQQRAPQVASPTNSEIPRLSTAALHAPGISTTEPSISRAASTYAPNPSFNVSTSITNASSDTTTVSIPAPHLSLAAPLVAQNSSISEADSFTTAISNAPKLSITEPKLSMAASSNAPTAPMAATSNAPVLSTDTSSPSVGFSLSIAASTEASEPSSRTIAPVDTPQSAVSNSGSSSTKNFNSTAKNRIPAVETKNTSTNKPPDFIQKPQGDALPQRQKTKKSPVLAKVTTQKVFSEKLQTRTTEDFKTNDEKSLDVVVAEECRKRLAKILSGQALAKSSRKKLKMRIKKQVLAEFKAQTPEASLSTKTENCMVAIKSEPAEDNFEYSEEQISKIACLNATSISIVLPAACSPPIQSETRDSAQVLSAVLPTHVTVTSTTSEITSANVCTVYSIKTIDGKALKELTVDELRLQLKLVEADKTLFDHIKKRVKMKIKKLIKSSESQTSESPNKASTENKKDAVENQTESQPVLTDQKLSKSNKKRRRKKNKKLNLAFKSRTLEASDKALTESKKDVVETQTESQPVLTDQTLSKSIKKRLRKKVKKLFLAVESQTPEASDKASTESKKDVVETQTVSAVEPPGSTGSKKDVVETKTVSAVELPRSSGSKKNVVETKTVSAVEPSGSTDSKKNVVETKTVSAVEPSGSTDSKKNVVETQTVSAVEPPGSTGSKKDVVKTKTVSAVEPPGSTGSIKDVVETKTVSAIEPPGSTGSKKDMVETKTVSAGEPPGSTGSKKDVIETITVSVVERGSIQDSNDRLPLLPKSTWRELSKLKRRKIRYLEVHEANMSKEGSEALELSKTKTKRLKSAKIFKETLLKNGPPIKKTHWQRPFVNPRINDKTFKFLQCVPKDLRKKLLRSKSAASFYSNKMPKGEAKHRVKVSKIVQRLLAEGNITGIDWIDEAISGSNQSKPHTAQVNNPSTSYTEEPDMEINTDDNISHQLVPQYDCESRDLEGSPEELALSEDLNAQKTIGKKYRGSRAGKLVKARNAMLAQMSGPRKRAFDEIPPESEFKRPKYCVPTTDQVDSTDDYLRVAIMIEPFENISAELASSLEKAIEEYMTIDFDDNISKPYRLPAFRHRPLYSEGVLKMWCEDDFSLQWLCQAVMHLSPRTESRLVVKSQTEIPRRPVEATMLIPGYNGEDFGTVLKALESQNPWYDIARWSIKFFLRQKQKDLFARLEVPSYDVKKLMEKDRLVHYKLGSVFVRFKDSWTTSVVSKRIHNQHNSAAVRTFSQKPFQQAPFPREFARPNLRQNQQLAGIGTDPIYASEPLPCSSDRQNFHLAHQSTCDRSTISHTSVRFGSPNLGQVQAYDSRSLIPHTYVGSNRPNIGQNQPSDGKTIIPHTYVGSDRPNIGLTTQHSDGRSIIPPYVGSNRPNIGLTPQPPHSRSVIPPYIGSDRPNIGLTTQTPNNIPPYVESVRPNIGQIQPPDGKRPIQCTYIGFDRPNFSQTQGQSKPSVSRNPAPQTSQQSWPASPNMPDLDTSQTFSGKNSTPYTSQQPAHVKPNPTHNPQSMSDRNPTAHTTYKPSVGMSASSNPTQTQLSARSKPQESRNHGQSVPSKPNVDRSQAEEPSTSSQMFQGGGRGGGGFGGGVGGGFGGGRGGGGGGRGGGGRVQGGYNQGGGGDLHRPQSTPAGFNQQNQRNYQTYEVPPGGYNQGGYNQNQSYGGNQGGYDSMGGYNQGGYNKPYQGQGYQPGQGYQSQGYQGRGGGGYQNEHDDRERRGRGTYSRGGRR